MVNFFFTSHYFLGVVNMEKAINVKNGNVIKIPKDMVKLRIQILHNGNAILIFKDT